MYFKTQHGKCINGDSLKELKKFEDNSIDLVITSPPFALQRQKEYGNETQEKYVDWFLEFAKLIYQKLKPTGSFVVDIGGAYEKGRPVRSLYQYRLVLRMCDEIGFNLAEDFYWNNPSKLPSPIEYVNKRKIRAKDSINWNLWFSKTDNPKADVTQVLTEYSDRMKKLLASNGKYYSAAERPSGHQISDSFNKDNGGAIPSNVLNIPNSESNSHYLKLCKAIGVKGHPARFPAGLPEFYIKMLTEEGDLVVDIFGGSCTTGMVAEALKRNWVTIELDREYFAASSFRFIEDEKKAKSVYDKLLNGNRAVTL